MLAWTARFCYQRKWLVIIVMIAGLVLANGVATGTGSDFRTDFALPDSESKDAIDLVEAASPADAGFTSQLVVKADQGIEEPEVKGKFEQFITEVRAVEPPEKADENDGLIMTVRSPFEPGGEQQIASQGPLADKIAFAELQVSDRDFEAAQASADEITAIGDRIEWPPGVTVEYGGDMFSEFEFPASELLGVLAAVLILLFAFGSVLAMGLPIGSALLGLGTGIALVTIASNSLSMPDFATQMSAMIGLGVGIDYSLFIVTRFREGLHRGLNSEEAVVEAVDTSGRAVLFAGITVIIALSGLFLSGLSFVQGIAVAAMLAVSTMVIGSLVLLPALLSLVGSRIEVTTFRGAIGISVITASVLLAVLFGAAAIAMVGALLTVVIIVASFTFAKQLAKQLPERRHKPREQHFWYRWSRFIQHRPWPAAIAGVVVLGILAIPLFSIRLGFGDAGNYAEKQSPRRAYDLLAEGFGPGSNGPLMLVIPGADAGDEGKLQDLRGVLEDTDNIAFVSPPVPLKDDLAIMTVYPQSAPQDKETTTLVNHLRDDVVPTSGTRALVGGFNAASVDFANYLGERLPIMIGFVLILSFVLLMVVFRSLLVPLKAVVMNLLSIGAAYGFVVALFQWGWGLELIGVDKSGPIDAWVPMMLFAIVFGLSMDYEVFLLSRIKEEYDATGDNGLAVADGLASTARVITAAALIMVCVFGAFVLGDDRSIKLFGLGMGVAVLIDATIVRMLLVPATMELLGDRNWWAPRWLLRVMPRVNVEGRGRVTALPTPASGGD